MYSHDRINLLSDAEIEAIYALPVFNEVEQALYFEFSDQEIAYAKKYRTVKLQLYFLLSLGYFKAKQRFYATDLIMGSVQDAQYIVGKYFATTQQASTLLSQIDDKTSRKQKNDILTLFAYREWSVKYKPQMESHICELLRYYPKGHNALRQLLIYFDERQIILPSYRTLQDMFTTAYSAKPELFQLHILAKISGIAIDKVQW